MGGMDVTEIEWMGTRYTNVQNRTNGRIVAISLFSDKYTKVGAQATSDVGTEDGDSQVNWEEISNPTCDFIAMGYRDTFVGTFFQQVDSTGAKVGEAISSEDVYVASDMVTMSDGRVCWPYVSMTWDLSQAIDDSASGSSTKKMSIAWLSLGDVASSAAVPASSTSSATVAATTAASTASSSSTAAATTASVDASSNVATEASDSSASASTKVAFVVVSAASSTAPAASGASSEVSSAAAAVASSDASSDSSNASPEVSPEVSAAASAAASAATSATSAALAAPAVSGSADTGFASVIPSAVPSEYCNLVFGSRFAV
ncbi:hypothetical protein N7467_009178 [Penicillium canescens]|nr:hypothetical protein N7467_009178 [Penicillium canescens]